MITFNQIIQIWNIMNVITKISAYRRKEKTTQCKIKQVY